MNYEEAWREGARRFGIGTSRYFDFMAGWRGTMRSKTVKEKEKARYGRGRRAREK